MSRKASGISATVQDIIDQLLPPKFDLRSAFDAALAPAGMPEGDGGDDDGDGGDDGSGGDDKDDDGTGGAGDGKDTIKDPEKKRLSDEAAAHRVKAKEAQKELEKAQAKLKELEDKDKSELDKTKSDLEAANAKIAKLEAAQKTAAVKLAFFDSGAAALFKNPSTALKLLDLDGIEPDEDGEVDSKEIKKRADALVKEEKYLAKGSDDDKDDDGDKPPSGGTNNGKRGNKDDLNKDALAKKFPALRR